MALIVSSSAFTTFHAFIGRRMVVFALLRLLLYYTSAILLLDLLVEILIIHDMRVSCRDLAPDDVVTSCQRGDDPHRRRLSTGLLKPLRQVDF